MIIHNSSAAAKEPAWENAVLNPEGKELENENAHLRLKTLAEKLKIPYVEIREFSNQNVSLIFNHILKVCLENRSDKSLFSSLKPK